MFTLLVARRPRLLRGPTPLDRTAFWNALPEDTDRVSLGGLAGGLRGVQPRAMWAHLPRNRVTTVLGITIEGAQLDETGTD